MPRISKREQKTKKSDTPPPDVSFGDGVILALAPTSQINNSNGDEPKRALGAHARDLKLAIYKFNGDTKNLVDSSSERAPLGVGLFPEESSKQSPILPGGQDSCPRTADPGVADEAVSIDPASPLLSPLFSPVTDVTAKTQASPALTLLAPSNARDEDQVINASIPQPAQPSVPSSKTAVDGSTAKQPKRPASVQGRLPVCALDIDILSRIPRAASAPLLAPSESSYQAQNASSKSRDRNRSFYNELYGNMPLDPSSVDPCSSTNRTSNRQSKQKDWIPVTHEPLLEDPAPITTVATTRPPAGMSVTQTRDLAKGACRKRKRGDREEDKTSAFDTRIQPTLSKQAPLTETEAPKPKRKRVTKQKVKKLNPYPTVPSLPATTTPQNEVPQQANQFGTPQVQEIYTDVPAAQIPFTNPNISHSEMFEPMNRNRPINNTAPVHAPTFEHTPTPPGPHAYSSCNAPRNLDINRPQEYVSSTGYPREHVYNRDSLNLQRSARQREQIMTQARQEAEFVSRHYPVPNVMPMQPFASEGSRNSQASNFSSQPLATGPSHFTQVAGEQQRTHPYVYQQDTISVNRNMQQGHYLTRPMNYQITPGDLSQRPYIYPSAINAQYAPVRNESPRPFSLRQGESGYMTGQPVVPANRTTLQNYPHSSFGNTTVASNNLQTGGSDSCHYTLGNTRYWQGK